MSVEAQKGVTMAKMFGFLTGHIKHYKSATRPLLATFRVSSKNTASLSVGLSLGPGLRTTESLSD